MRVLLDEANLLALVYGGAILGAGGGGSIKAGLAAGRAVLATGRPLMVSLDELSGNSVLATFSRVGTVSSTHTLGRLADQHTRALELFQSLDGYKIGGIIPSEIGPLAVTYGWRQAINSGIPIVDAPCNGRAHPTGIMGSLGLHRFPNHVTKTIAVGTDPRTGAHFEMDLHSTLSLGAYLVRDTVARSGIPLAVVRNPLPVSYVRKHAAIGGLSFAKRVGEMFLQAYPKGLEAVIQYISGFMNGYVLSQGSISFVTRNERHGFTIGELQIKDKKYGLIRIPICNEYMMVLCDHQAVASFPDLITLFDEKTSLPVNTADARVGQKVVVLIVPAGHLKLASTMYDRELLRPIEKLLGLPFPESKPSTAQVCGIRSKMQNFSRQSTISPRLAVG